MSSAACARSSSVSGRRATCAKSVKSARVSIRQVYYEISPPGLDSAILPRAMPERDPDHWLYRLDAGEWLRAAENELKRAEAALTHKQQRAGVAGARRAAGMAWNAVL